MACYYLERGFQLYFPVVRQGVIDMVVHMPDGLRTVQVKGAYWNKSGLHSYLQCRMRTTNKYQVGPQAGHYDLVLVVFEDEIWEIPAKEIASSNISLRGSCDGYQGTAWDKYKVR